jgi:hypothetical protein
MARQWMRSTALALVLVPLAAAQEINLPPKPDATVPRLELKPDPAVEKGRVAAVQGTLGPEPIRYAIGELSILQPVVVMLLSHDATDDLTLSLFKGDWTTVRRTGSTKGSGIASFEFRTQGGVNILLRGSSTPVPFALVVWAGNELHPPMSDVVVTHDEFLKRKPVATPAVAAQQRPTGTVAPGREQASEAGGTPGVPVVISIVAAAVLGGAGTALFLRTRRGGRHDHST